jgi:integrase
VAAGHVEISPIETWMRREKGGRRTIPWLRDAVRDRVLTDAEIARLWSASETVSPLVRAFVRVLLLTACRSSEITGLAWREVQREPAGDGPERCLALMLPATRTKNRHAHRVPLAELAQAELDALLHECHAATLRTTPASILDFPGMASRVAGVCRSLRKAAGFDNWSWHDMRRSAATAMARLGCPREHVEAALNHITDRGGLIGIYQRYNFENEGAQALLRWQTHVAALVSPSSVAPVVPIRRPR